MRATSSGDLCCSLQRERIVCTSEASVYRVGRTCGKRPSVRQYGYVSLRWDILPGDSPHELKKLPQTLNANPPI
jgi:hypothetical protein